MILKDVIGYEGLYKVSDSGHIFNVNKEFWLKESMTDRGYLTVHLKKDKISTTHYVHRIVAQAFISNPNDLPQVNHKDEIKTNNNVSNLEWVTPRENLLYGSRLEIVITREMFETEQRDMCDNILNVFPSISEASRQTGIDKGNICQCTKGKKNSAGGYKWTLVDITKSRTKQ